MARNDTKHIESLTPEQEALLPVYRDRWLEIGLSTEPTDQDAARQAVNECYTSAGLTPPESILFVASPDEALDTIQRLAPTVSRSDISNNFCWNQHDAGSLGFYAFFHEVIGLPGLEKIIPLLNLAKVCGWVSFYEEVAVVQDRPEIIRFDDTKRLHAENGKAADGQPIDIAGNGVHKIDVWVPDLDPTRIYWEGLAFDHDCL